MSTHHRSDGRDRRHRTVGDGPQPRPQPGPARIHRRAAQPQRRTHPQPDRRPRRRGRVRAERVDGGLRRVAAAARARSSSWCKAGDATDAVIDELIPLLDRDDIIIDCGNAHFIDTERREKALAEQGLHFVGTGVSGGEEGALNGPSIMPGGSDEAYQKLGPIFETHRRAGRRRAVHHPRRPGRGRSLRQDGAQRHRVRRHAAHRRGVRPAAIRPRRQPGRDRRDLPRVEHRRPRVVPDRDHRRRARARRRGDRQAVHRRRRRPGRAEGHRPLDRAERARPRRPDHRHRRGDVRPVAVGPRRPARGGPARVRRARRRHRRWPTW